MLKPNPPTRVTSDAEPVIEDHELRAALKRLERISRLFDEAVRVPGIGLRLGWDAVLGLIPVGGDALTTLITAYYLWEARRLGARKRVLVKMLANSGVDFVVGLVPLVGDLADVTWRANRKNMRALIKELQAIGRLPKDMDADRIAKLLGDRPAAKPGPGSSAADRAAGAGKEGGPGAPSLGGPSLGATSRGAGTAAPTA